MVKTKFSIGQHVFIEKFESDITNPCYICDGSGRVSVKDKGFNCPKCYGSGKVSTGKSGNVPYEKVITAIILDKHGAIKYQTKGMNGGESRCYYENQIFANASDIK